MDADALLHPRGPLPPGVYWRRRVGTLLGVVVVLFGASRACGSDGEPRAGVSPTPSASATTTPRPTKPAVSRTASPTASPVAAAGQCRAADLVVNARAGAQLYPAGQRPVLTIGIANKGARPCTFDVGQANRGITVTSGNDRVWSSDDCSPGGGAQVVALQPGAEPTEFSVTWARRRSRPGCPAGQPEAAPGTYRVVGRFGELVSQPDSFSLR
ncbi:MAG TPA: hypothetical protein VNA20_09720 [Frankiaceae bacterium]|nr:hypothetical protein [Frankiaceae bacterium]